MEILDSYTQRNDVTLSDVPLNVAVDCPFTCPVSGEEANCNITRRKRIKRSVLNISCEDDNSTRHCFAGKVKGRGSDVIFTLNCVPGQSVDDPPADIVKTLKKYYSED